MKKKMVFMYKMQVGGDKYNSKCKVRLRALRSNCYSCSYIPLHALFFKFLLLEKKKEWFIYPMFTHQIGDSLLPRNNRVIKCLPKEFYNFLISNILASCFCCTTL